MAKTEIDPRFIRQLMRGCDRTSLAVTLSSSRDQTTPPYVALVLVAFDMAGNPLLFISDLAEHTKALRENPTCSLLFDGTIGRKDALSGARVTLQGRAEFLSDQEAQHAKQRFISRHPSAAIYQGFQDFNLVRITPDRAHLVAGFGKIQWIDWSEISLNSDSTALIDAEEDVITHMNEDHSDVVNLIANKLLKENEVGWRLVGLDPDGCDLFLDGKLIRYPFPDSIATANDARLAFIDAAKIARQS